MKQRQISNDILPSLPAHAPTGVLLLCTGKRGDLLRNCVRSLRDSNPNLPFHLLADRPYDVPFEWVKSWTGKASRRIKTQLHRYTPYDVTLFADDDTVFAKPLDLREMLGDSDMALALDVLPTLSAASCMVKWPHHVSSREVKETISACGKDHRFYNTGVMLWRNDSPVVREFFDLWWREWKKYEKCDQFAFARALKNVQLKFKLLASSYNSGVYDGTCAKDAAIYHLLGKREAAQRHGLWKPISEGPFEVAFAKAVNNGLMGSNQYQFIARELFCSRSCSVLVIGTGHDSDLWFHCAEGNVAYVENNPAYLDFSPIPALRYTFESNVGEWRDVPNPPAAIDRPWDFVIVDGPNGHTSSAPGRQFPIAWAARLARKAVFVHDYERPWECQVCDKYLGDPSEIVEARGRGDRCLAVFRFAEKSPASLPIEVSNPSRVITIKLFNRPAYTTTTLNALEKCTGIENYKVLIFIEPGNDEVIALAHAARFPDKQVTVNATRLGITANTFQALNAGFELGDFVIHLEDDTVPAPDFLLFMEHCQNAYRHNPFVFSVCGYQYSNPTLPASLFHAVEKRLHFNPWGWGTWKDRWEEMKARWSDIGIPNAFSGFMKNFVRKERYEIMPLLARIQNIGSLGGHNTSPDGHARFQFNEHWAGNRTVPDGKFWEQYVDTRLCYTVSFRERPDSVWRFQNYCPDDGGVILYLLRAELLPNICVIKEADRLSIRIHHYFRGTLMANRRFRCTDETEIRFTSADLLINGESIRKYVTLSDERFGYLFEHAHYITNHYHNNMAERAQTSFLRPVNSEKTAALTVEQPPDAIEDWGRPNIKSGIVLDASFEPGVQSVSSNKNR
jgi:hypothetical protein